MLRSDVLCVVIPYRCRAVLCIAWHCFVCRAPAMPCCNYTSALCMYVCMYVCTYTWRFMGTYKWGYKSPNMGHKYSYPTYNPTYIYP